MRIIIAVILLTVIASCDKGYRVRFSNYHTEVMDSVNIGNKVFFTAVPTETTTDFKKIAKGTQFIRCKTHSGKIFSGSMFVSSHGGGDRTVQIDGTGSVVVLEK